MTEPKLEDWVQSFKNHHLWLSGEVSGEVKSITADSRHCQLGKEGVVFFARKGLRYDGHDFLSDLKECSGIVAAVVEKLPPQPETFGFPFIEVRDSTEAMAVAAKALFKDPSREAFCFAVTGTNGKTTSTYLAQSLLNTAGFRTAVSGTVKTTFEGKDWVSALTTPDFVELQRTFSELKDAGANAFAFEASSHAIDQRRLLGVELNVALFTNLSPEHLDYHGTMEEYYQAKKKLFSEFLPKSQKERKYVIAPEDGTYGSRLVEELQGEKDLQLFTWSYAEKKFSSSLVIEDFKTDLRGSQFTVTFEDGSAHVFRTPLVGRFNIENVMGVVTLGYALGVDFRKIQLAIDKVECVPGRLEAVDTKGRGRVFVDYAHTPDALENILMVLRPLTEGRLKVVFGCGGDRDKLKRPKMGSIAELHTDEIYITSDNPRTETPQKIIEDIREGLQNLKPTHIVTDRREAIAQALSSLDKNDVLVIAGKGHEDYQIIGNERISFDDREVVRLALS